MHYEPKTVIASEWREIVKIRAVRDGWGLETEADKKAFAESTYAARFDYISDGPGYVGDLFVILGGEPECPPMVIVRRKGVLEVADSRRY
jgi:hypothetical protein